MSLKTCLRAKEQIWSTTISKQVRVSYTRQLKRGGGGPLWRTAEMEGGGGGSVEYRGRGGPVEDMIVM